MSEQPFPQPDPSDVVVPGESIGRPTSQPSRPSRVGVKVMALGLGVAVLVASVRLLAGPGDDHVEPTAASQDAPPATVQAAADAPLPTDGTRNEGGRSPVDSVDDAVNSGDAVNTGDNPNAEDAGNIEAETESASAVTTEAATDDRVGDESLEHTIASRVDEFIEGFVDAHRRGDVEGLDATLHPSIKLAFGGDTCSDYITETAGSILAARIVDVGVARPLRMDTPLGPIEFESAVPFTVEFLTAGGAIVTNPANLPIHDGEVRWLTTCGVTVD